MSEQASASNTWTTAMQLVSLGYVLTRPFPRPAYKSEDLLPSTIISASECLARFLPDIWALRWVNMTDDERATAANHFSIDGAHIDAVIHAATCEFDAGHLKWPHTFESVSSARSFASRFYTSDAPLWLVGLGIDAVDANVIAGMELPVNAAAPAVVELASATSELEGGSQLLGWEILGVEPSGEMHSWLCNELETLVHRLRGTTTNSVGLIEDHEDARVAAELCSRPSSPSEPVPWFAAALVRFPLTDPGDGA